MNETTQKGVFTLVPSENCTRALCSDSLYISAFFSAWGQGLNLALPCPNSAVGTWKKGVFKLVLSNNSTRAPFSGTKCEHSVILIDLVPSVLSLNTSRKDSDFKVFVVMASHGSRDWLGNIFQTNLAQYHKFSLPARTTTNWSSLPAHAIDQLSVEAFKASPSTFVAQIGFSYFVVFTTLVV